MKKQIPAGRIITIALVWCGTAAAGTALAQDASKADDALMFKTPEIEALIIGRTLYLVDTFGSSAGNTVRMFFDPAGTVRASSSSGISNSGPYTIKNNRLCYEWGDKRWGTNWCFILKKDNDVTHFITPRSSNLKWIMKTSKDGNPDQL